MNIQRTQKNPSSSHKYLSSEYQTQQIKLPRNFKKFNKIIGNPIHPNTGLRTEIFDYQEEYEQKWNKYHKLMLNKSRKIGATETALRIIAYNSLTGPYSGHRVMIVAGNKQDVANRFIQRFKDIFEPYGFRDLNGKLWEPENIILESDKKSMRLATNVFVQAYPANEAVRGEENVACVFLSECAFINLLDDSGVYNALHPNVANIENADFVMESTPNGKRGFFWDLFTTQNEYYKLEHPYTVSMGKLLTPEFIESEKHNTQIDFEQEYNCQFTTSKSAAFDPDSIVYKEQEVTDYSDIINGLN